MGENIHKDMINKMNSITIILLKLKIYIDQYLYLPKWLDLRNGFEKL